MSSIRALDECAVPSRGRTGESPSVAVQLAVATTRSALPLAAHEEKRGRHAEVARPLLEPRSLSSLVRLFCV